MTITEEEVRRRLIALADHARTVPVRTPAVGTASARSVEGYPVSELGPSARPARTKRLIAVATAAAAAAAALAVLAVNRHSGHPVTITGPSARQPVTTTLSAIPERQGPPAEVSVLPSPPIPVRDQPDSVWTGTEWILVGAGYSVNGVAQPAVSAAYTPGGGWSTLPTPPVPLLPATSLWDGSQVLVFNEAQTSRSSPGAAYDPANRTWTEIPAPPARIVGSTAVWTGTEAIVMSSTSETAYTVEAYNPALRTWRQLASTPGSVSLNLVWTGKTLFSFLPAQHPQQSPAGSLIAYDPATNRWQTVPGSPPGLVQVRTIEWYDQQILVFDADHTVHNYAYSPATGTWRSLATENVDPMAFELLPGGWTGSQAIFSGQKQLVVYDAARDTWTTYPFSDSTGGPADYSNMDSVWTGHQMYAWYQNFENPAGHPSEVLAISLPSNTGSRP